MTPAPPSAKSGGAAAPHEVLPADIADRVARLGFEARRASAAVLSGHHRSRRHGESAVFVEHREYRRGDDPRRLDWRVFARTDRPAVRHYEHESQHRALLALDRSDSMRFSDDGARRNKLEFGATLVAAMAHLLSSQGDAFGLALFDDGHEAALPVKATPDHLSRALRRLALELGVPGAGHTGNPKKARTALPASFASLAERARRAHGVLVVSDLLDPPRPSGEEPAAPAGARLETDPDPREDRTDLAPLFAAMALPRRELWVVHVLTRTERELDVSDASLFVGLEEDARLIADPEALREEYREEVARFTRGARDAVSSVGGRYVLASPDDDVASVLHQLLRGRGGS